MHNCNFKGLVNNDWQCFLNYKFFFNFRIWGVESENGGVYRCEVRTPTGTIYDDYVLAIQGKYKYTVGYIFKKILKCHLLLFEKQHSDAFVEKTVRLFMRSP